MMGRKARTILQSVNVTQQELENFDAMKEKFQADFVHTKIAGYESACFKHRKQEMEETVEEFVTTLPELASRCEFNDMKERTVHDRFVVSLHDQSLSEALQMDPKRISAIAVARATTRKTLKK